MSRRLLSPIFLVLLLVWTTPAALAAEESTAVNPPGWVGGLVLILAIGLALGAWFLIRRGRLF